MANSKIYLGSTNIGSLFNGASDVSIYLGSEKVYPLCTPHTPPVGATWTTYSSTDVQPYGTICYGIRIDTANIDYPPYNDIQLIFADVNNPLTFIAITYYNADGEWHTQYYENEMIVFDRLSNIDGYILTEEFSEIDICNEFEYVEDEPCNICELPTEFEILQVQPPFEGKWKATYSDSHTESAQCDSSSVIIRNEINKTNLVSVEIGDCVTSIGQDSFQNCYSLTNVIIGDNVTSIGAYAFDICSGMTSCTIGNGVIEIGRWAFQGCSFSNITIPSGVTSVGNYAFYSCSRLTSIKVNAVTPPTLGYDPFYNTNNCVIYVPSQSVNAYKSASGWSDYADRIQAIPNS